MKKTLLTRAFAFVSALVIGGVPFISAPANVKAATVSEESNDAIHLVEKTSAEVYTSAEDKTPGDICTSASAIKVTKSDGTEVPVTDGDLTTGEFHTSMLEERDGVELEPIAFFRLNTYYGEDTLTFEYAGIKSSEEYIVITWWGAIDSARPIEVIDGSLTAKINVPETAVRGSFVIAKYLGEVEVPEKPETPEIPVLEKPYKIANVVSGVHVYWKAPEGGASKYGLWRSETGINGEYKWVANPTVPHFTDTKVESGKTYYYKVTVLDTETNTHGNKSEAIGVVFTSTPDITSRINKAAGVQLGWEKIEGATGYGIYRKTYSGNDAWVRIATIDNGDTLNYTDAEVKGKNGSIYKYTIRALAGKDNKTLSGCRNAGRTMVRLASRTLNSAQKVNNTSIKCNWTTSSAVTGYEVRFMTDGEVFKTFTVGNCKIGTKTFTGLTAGKTYKVQVRSYKKVANVGSFYSAWSKEKNVILK